MGSRPLYGDDVWRKRRTLAYGAGVGYVVVAYRGGEPFERLPLAKGSVLVVDASKAAVRDRLTNRAGLARYGLHGAKVYSAVRSGRCPAHLENLPASGCGAKAKPGRSAKQIGVPSH